MPTWQLPPLPRHPSIAHFYLISNGRYDEGNVASRRSGRITGGVWGWMAWSGVGELTEIEHRLTAQTYVEILEEVMLPSVRALLIPEGENFYMLQNKSPIHTARIVQDWFAAHPEITLLHWPPRSPDLNPIEDLWLHINKKWVGCDARSQRVKFNKMNELWESLRRELEITQHLVESMPRRLQQVIEANGGHTKY